MIADLVRRIAEAVKKARPGIIVMASLLSDPDTAAEYGQNWDLCSKWIDFSSPMNYGELSLDAALLSRQRGICRETGSVFIPALGGDAYLHREGTVSSWAQRLERARAAQSDGVILYRLGDLDPGILAFLGNGPFHERARFPAPPRR